MTPPARDADLCTATLELLTEVGYERMSMDAIAARAHASKATIYRHWPGKKELVLHALRVRGEACAAQVHAVDTGSLREDLVLTMTAMARLGDPGEGELFAGVLQAMRESPELSACLRDQVFERRGETVRAVIARAVTRGELTAGAPATLATEVAGAMWSHRMLVVGGTADHEFIVHLVDDVLIPLLDPPGRASCHHHPEETS